jgi:hypothetical protein
MKMTKHEANAIINMFLSPDQDNEFMAFKATEAHDFGNTDFGWLLYIYKFSRMPFSKWKEHASKCASTLSVYYDFDNPFTYAKGLSIMIEQKASHDSVTAFLEKHVAELVEMLGNMGYPVDNLDFNLTLKK